MACERRGSEAIEPRHRGPTGRHRHADTGDQGPRPSIRWLALAAVPQVWDVDTTKLRGFRIKLTWRRAALSIADPSHNDFFNMMTDILPMLAVGAVCAHLYSAGPLRPTSTELHAAIVTTTAATTFQHLCSLVGHTFYVCSARLSHAIWFLDYAGILLEFVWNAPAMALVAWPSLGAAGWLPWWGAANALLSAVVVGSAAAGVYTFEPSSGRSVDITAALCWHGSGLGLLLVLLLIIPNFGLTLIAAREVDGSLHAVLPLMCVALLLKGSHVPERWAKPGRLDFSLMHSHVVWHLCVCALQAIYMCSLLRALSQS
jgi:hypothetical protein